MPKLILQSSRILEVGRRYKCLYDAWGNRRPEQYFLVVRESTREEWIEALVEWGEDRGWAEILAVLDPYFYEVLTD